MLPFKFNEKKTWTMAKTSKGIISTLGSAILLRNYHGTTISCHANNFSISIWGDGEQSYISMTDLQRVKTPTPYRDRFLVFAICLRIYFSGQFSVDSKLLAQLSFKKNTHTHTHTNYYYILLKNCPPHSGHVSAWRNYT
jgi:hypothetical protein